MKELLCKISQRVKRLFYRPGDQQTPYLQQRLLFIFKQFYVSFLDLNMNNTIHQFFHKLLKCSTSIRTVERNVKDAQLTVIQANVIPLVIGANLLAIFLIIKIKQGKFSSPHILFLILCLSDSVIGMIQTDRNLRQVEIKLPNMF